MQQQDSAVGGCYRGHKGKWTQTGIGQIPEGETHQFLLQTAKMFLGWSSTHLCKGL